MTPLVTVALLLTMLGVHLVDACSCLPEHPQYSYCRSDFVIVARVKKMFQKKEDTKIFKIKIKKIFKATSNKTIEALQTGMLWTSGDSMCGVDLMIDKTYLLAGFVMTGQARISLCSYHELWDHVTNKQRKGFRLLYKRTCSVCEVFRKTWWSSEVVAIEPNECLWDTNSYPGSVNLPDCQALYSICTKQPSGHCGWMSDRLNQECMKKRKSIRKEELDREP